MLLYTKGGKMKNLGDKIKNENLKLVYATLMAIAFGLPGCLFYGVMYYFGWFVWAAAYLAVLAVAVGYQMFYKKIDWKGWIIIALVSVIEMTLTIYVSVNFVIVKAFKAEGVKLSLFGGFKYISEFMKYPEFKGAFISDLVGTIIMIVVAFISILFYEKFGAKIRKKKNDDQESENITSDELKSQTNVIESEPVVEEKEEVKPRLEEEHKQPVKKVRKCPNCSGILKPNGDLYICETCGKKYRITKKQG